MNEAIIFTDGASRGNPGPGGWGTIVVSHGEVHELGGREENTTNNRMELQAAISGLSFFFKKYKDAQPIVYTDSSYVLRGATQWLRGWREKNWMATNKKEILNKDLWERMLSVIDGKQIDWRLLSGHVGVVGNERADKIATAFADNKKEELFSGSLESYGIDILNVSHDPAAKAKRSSSKSRSGAKAYSYVSKVGGVIMVHKTWQECEKRVRGTSGALYKKALSETEEKEIISDFESR